MRLSVAILRSATPRRTDKVKLYSHSRLSSYENCKKKFEFRYILDVPQESEGVEAFVGKRVHEILERLYLFVAREQLPSLKRVLERYYAIFDEHYDVERIRIVKAGLDRNHYRELGAQCISIFYHRHYPFDADETLGLERRVVFPLDDEGRYGIQGIIDRVVRAADGSIEIQDYKTGAWVPNQKALDADRQLALYQIGVSAELEEPAPIRLVWHYLAKGQIRTSTRTPEQLDALRSETLGLVEKIEAETDWSATKNKLCNWCEYRDVCPAWGASETTPPRPGATAAAAETKQPGPQPGGQANLL
jgi:putative RecB family exonuclease